MFRYEAKEIKKIFPVLGRFDDVICIPIFSAIMIRFLYDLSSDWREYEINGFDLISEFDGIKSLEDVYVAMSGAAVIKVVLHRTDIYVVNGGLVWYLPSSITFNAGNLKELAKDLYDKFIDFVKRQNLQELKDETCVALRKGRIKSLRPEIVEFYLS